MALSMHSPLDVSGSSRDLLYVGIYTSMFSMRSDFDFCFCFQLSRISCFVIAVALVQRRIASSKPQKKTQVDGKP